MKRLKREMEKFMTSEKEEVFPSNSLLEKVCDDEFVQKISFSRVLKTSALNCINDRTKLCEVYF